MLKVLTEDSGRSRRMNAQRVNLKRGFIGLCAVAIISVIMVAIHTATATRATMFPLSSSTNTSTNTSTITPLQDTPHFMISAYADDRADGWDVRVISILKKDATVPLHCVFICGGGHLSDRSTPAGFQGDMGFGFPFESTFVMCRIPTTCVDPTHVTLSVRADVGEEARRQSFLPIRNRKTKGGTEEEPQVDFTVCIPTLFGDYNNVLQFAQALEMYRLLGVDRVVLYNTSCGPDLDRLLQAYAREGFVEVVPWPIDKHITPSRGWKYLEHGEGDLHYYGQMATLNDCMYRNMERSRYVLLHDIDKIILPYRHDNLTALVSELRKQQPQAGAFQFQVDFFPHERVKPFRPPQWEGVPGINILEHIYRINAERHLQKMIVKPKMVEEASVHFTVKQFGNTYQVPADVARVMHVRCCRQGVNKQAHVDTRLWHFSEKLIASVDQALGRVGMLRTNA